MFQESVFYNAFEKDIAVVNIFFASSTVFGLDTSHFQRYTCGSLQIVFLEFGTTKGEAGVCQSQVFIKFS